MNPRLDTLRAAALTIAKQFRSHNLREFIPRRTDDHIKRIQSLVDQNEITKEIDYLEEFVRTSERQVAIQNMYNNNKSVLDS
jgi:hypothetical protein